jgi:transketolase N-terminal domain/subunit
MAGHSTERVLRGSQASKDPRANALRALAMDGVQAANSGHPGAPMGMAEMAVALWTGHLRHDPAEPRWPDRDRFVLSNGHASMLLYALLHLSGYDLPLDEIKRFRQLGSKTPGHPEVGHTPGVETTTGPLGQGLANAVGMALAEQLLAAEFNRPGHTLVDHRTYVFLGDGCLMEGISHEVCALAGVWGLNKLVALYDDNGISIDGPVQGWFRDDTAGALQGLWLERDRPHRRPRRGGGGPCAGAVAHAHRRAHAHHLPHHHRPGLAGACRHRQGAWRTAGCRRDRGHAPGHRLDPWRVRGAGRRACGLGRKACGGHPPRRMAVALDQLPRRLPRAGGRVRTPHGR